MIYILPAIVVFLLLSCVLLVLGVRLEDENDDPLPEG